MFWRDGIILTFRDTASYGKGQNICSFINSNIFEQFAISCQTQC